MREEGKPLNGIVLNGKFYEAVECDDLLNHCGVCALYDECATDTFPCVWMLTDKKSYYRFSKSITDKINEK